MMSKMTVTTFSLMQFRSALKLDEINESLLCRKKTGFLSIINKVKTIFLASVLDRYAEVEFNTVIMGKDIVLSLICAIALNKASKKVLICFPDTVSEKMLPVQIINLELIRSQLVSSEICDIIENVLSIKITERTIDGVMKSLCEEISSIESMSGKKMTYFAGNFHLYLSNMCVTESDDKVFFSVNKIDSSLASNAPDFWSTPRLMLNKFYYTPKPSRLSQPNLLIEADNLLLTSFIGYDISKLNANKINRIGSAIAETQSLRWLGDKQRIIDIVSAANIISMQNNPDALKNLKILWENHLNEK